jgi:DNA polymerase III subunit alpha
MSFFHTHVHSEYSCLDGMADISTMVDKAVRFKQPGLAITDHGNMSGCFQLYKAAREQGVIPFPGLEAYLVDDTEDKKAKRYHITLLALTTAGYQVLTKLCTKSHTRERYHYKPRIGLSDLAAMAAEGATADIACLTGCYFGMVQQALVNDGEEQATRIAKMLAGWFPHTYVEIQHHHTDHGEDSGWTDDDLAMALLRISQAIGRPPIVTQDCHYCDKAHKPLHDMMKAMAYSGDAGDYQFPGDSYHLASTPWVKKHYRGPLVPVWEASNDSYSELLELNKVCFPMLDTYAYHVPALVKSPMAKLRKVCRDELVDGMYEKLPEYVERLEYEFSTISKLKMADYFLLVHEYVKWCAEENILVMARGSAAGSLVCYLLGITQVDPLKWNLTFDRFLTPDRIRPPDIDLDIEDVRRDDVVDYLSNKFGVIQIGTYNRLGYDEETGRGGLFVQYISGMRKKLKDDFARELGKVQNLHDLDKIRPDDANLIRGLAGVPVRRSPGSHAAGFVIAADDHLVSDWIPTMLIPSSGTTVTQMTMDDVENAGFVKIDLLGLRSLTTMRRCLELLGKTSPSFIPLDDRATMTFLRKGRPETGVFQLEGFTAAQGCREVKVKTVRDLILVNALYRPATRDHGYTDLFLKNRADPSSVEYIHPIFKRHLEETYGVPVFQEQVLAILRDLGMPVEQLNDFLQAVKGKRAVAGYSSKSAAIFRKHRAEFDSLCEKAGLDEKGTEEAWALVEGFAAYGFNRAHATAYSLFGYQMAYMKVHYPLEFHAALLETTAGTPKEKKYIREARTMGIRILAADVNESGVSWKMNLKSNSIRRGLLSTKGVGRKAAECVADHAPFDSIEELISRCPARAVTGGKKWAKDRELTGILRQLQEAGALKSLGVYPQ